MMAQRIQAARFVICIRKDGRFVVTHKSNEGVSVARNTGIEKSKGQYIMFIDADDRLENNTLSVIRTACDNQNNPDIVMFNYYENIDSSALYGMDWLNEKRRLNQSVCLVDCVPGAMLAVNTQKFLRTQGYDERNFLYCEENMLAKKVRNHGWKTVLLVCDTYIHNHSVSINKSIPGLLNKYALVLNARMFYLENYGGISRLGKCSAKLFFSYANLRNICLKKQNRFAGGLRRM